MEAIPTMRRPAPPTRPPGKGRIWLERFLLIAGIAGLAVWAYFSWGTQLWRNWQDRKFDEAVAKREEAPKPAPQPKPQEGSVVGRLSIPRLHIRSVVREGANDGVLSASLGHIPGTALPGESGNVGVAGHRDTLFRGLKNISRDDRIQLQTVDKRYDYQVESTRVVQPQDVEVLNPGKDSELTLVTCYPFYYIGSAPERFIVKARLVTEKPAQEAAAPVVKAMEKAPAKTPAKEPVQVAVKAPLPYSAPLPYKAPPPERLTMRAVYANDGPERVRFEIAAGSGRELVPGKVWFGLASTDAEGHKVDGWLRMMPSRKTVWLRKKDVNKPFFFSGDKGQFELVVTRVTDDSVTGYLVEPGANDRSAMRR
jgi:sortase A